MSNPFERLALAAETQKGFTFEIEQCCSVIVRAASVAARKNPRQLAADERVVIADAARASGEVHAQLQGGVYAFPPDANRLTRMTGL